MFLDNKNILEYAQITQSEPKSIILYIEGRSNIYYSKLASTYTYFEVVQYFISDILRGVNCAGVRCHICTESHYHFRFRSFVASFRAICMRMYWFLYSKNFKIHAFLANVLKFSICSMNYTVAQLNLDMYSTVHV